VPSDLTDSQLRVMSDRYRSVRRAVFEEATRPASCSAAEHQANQNKLKLSIAEVCSKANLSHYSEQNRCAADRIWQLMWRTNRYGGIKNTIAKTEIAGIQAVFDDYEVFSTAAWNIEISRQSQWNRRRNRSTPHFVVASAGTQASDFLNRRGAFRNAQTIGNLPKLRTVVAVARKLKLYMDNRPADAPPIHFVTGGHDPSDVWSIHRRLIDDVGYRSHLTALHFMMDAGFQVMKPDIVISSLFHSWQWLDLILPNPVTRAELKMKYTRPALYTPIIELSRKIVAATSAHDLRDDIGWVTDNPLREFDIFVVKYGQVPDEDYGIVRSLSKSSSSAEYPNLNAGSNCSTRR
jgi:hypothetical protein